MMWSDFCMANSLMESAVCQLVNIVIHEDRQKLMFYEYGI